MELQNNYNNHQNSKEQPWYGSKTSCQSDKSDGFMTFQSRDPIISIPMQDKHPKDKSDSGGGGGGHGHGIQVEHPTSYAETLMHLFKGNVGSGIFAMGDAMRNAGIIVGPIVVLILGVICVHCQHLLLKASKIVTEKSNRKTAAPDFAETVELCFEHGPPSLQRWSKVIKRIVNIFLCVTQLGFCCVYFVFISENIKQVLDYYGYELDVHFHMAIILLPILLTSLIRNLKYLAPFSTIANVFMGVGIVIVLYYSSKELPEIDERDYIADFEKLPLFFGTALFAFEGIGLVLPLQNNMKEPKKFKSPLGVLNVGMTVVIALYISVGFLAYLQYGENIQGSVTLNLDKDDKLAQSVKVIISVGILLTYSLQFYIAVDIIWPNVHKFLGPTRHPVFAELAFRCFLVFITFILAEAIPFLSLFISLVGAVSSTALALIFPAILELVTSYTFGELNSMVILKDGAILLIGIFGMFLGGYESIVSIIKAFQS